MLVLDPVQGSDAQTESELAIRHPAYSPLPRTASESETCVNHDDRAELGRRIEKLSEERVRLFARAGVNMSTAELAADATRLKAIERELDECFMALRRSRATRDARRFGAEDRFLRSRIDRPGPSVAGH
jgi:hypothetical protein